MSKPSRLRHWFRRFVDKLAGRFYEGPEPPQRLEQAVAAFAVFHPHATVREWVDFASAHAQECYRSGYLRGVEHQVRNVNDLETPALMQAQQQDERHDWSWVNMAPSEQQMQALVEQHSDVLERLSPEERLLYMDSIGRAMGGYKVQLIGMGPKKEGA